MKENFLAMARKRIGLTQEDIGNALGVKKQTIYKYEKGESNIPPKYWKTICKLLNITEDDIIEHNAISVISKKEYGNSADTIQNTPELRECIKDAMMKNGITSASDLCRAINYDSSNTIERLLSGKLNWFPDVLSAILDTLSIDHDAVPVTAREREMLLPEGVFRDGAILVRPIPVVDWANAAGYLGTMTSNATIFKHWDPATTEVVPAPMGVRKGTIALKVYGESMEPRIQDGDILYCQPAFSFEDIPNNKIVVVRFSDDYAECPDCVVCKRLTKIGGQIILISDNQNGGKNFSDITMDKVEWLGVVTSKFSNL